MGIEVSSRWLDEKTDVNHNLDDVKEDYNVKVAKQDVEDIDTADALVLFSENPLESFKRGGRHWETGYAYGKGKLIIVVGPKENIFHYLPKIYVYKDFNELKGVLSLLKTWEDTFK